MVDKDGNIWGPDAWPDLVQQHFADVYKALELEIMAEKRELENPSHEALQHGGHEFWQWRCNSLKGKACRKSTTSTLWWLMWM